MLIRATILAQIILLVAKTVTQLPSESHVAQLAGIVSQASALAPSEPVVIVGADAETTELIHRSIARFTQAGLELPAIEFRVHPVDDSNSNCDGHDGYWHPRKGSDLIDVCDPYERLVLHEIAHAWEHHSIDDTTRSAFMTLHPGYRWQSDTASPLSHLSDGIERFAEAVAFGLKDRDIPTDNVPALRDKLDTFEMITGITSPRLTTTD